MASVVHSKRLQLTRALSRAARARCARQPAQQDDDGRELQAL